MGGPWKRGCRRGPEKITRTGLFPCPGRMVIFFPGPLSGPVRIVVRRCSHVPWDSATALLFGAAFAALGRGLLGVTFCAASAAFGVAFLAASTGVGTASSHHAGARKKSGDADPCQELPEFLCVHGTPPFSLGCLFNSRHEYTDRKSVSAPSGPVKRRRVNCTETVFSPYKINGQRVIMPP